MHGDSEKVCELSRKAKDLFFCPVYFAPGWETSHNTHRFKRRSKCEKTLSSYLEHSIFPAENGVPQVTFALYQRKFNSTVTALKIGMRNCGPGMIPVSAEALSGYQLNYIELNAVALWCFFLCFFPLQLSYLSCANCSNSLPQWKDFRNRSCLQGRREVLICWPMGHKSPLTDGKKKRKVPRGLDTKGFYEQ